MTEKCFNCGAEARWRDSHTGAHRCRRCVAIHGAGRGHVVLPSDLAELDADGTVVAEETDDPVAVWDELEAQRNEFRDDAGWLEWADCVIEQGKTQAMEIERLRAQLAASMPLPLELLKGRKDWTPPELTWGKTRRAEA